MPQQQQHTSVRVVQVTDTHLYADTQDVLVGMNCETGMRDVLDLIRREEGKLAAVLCTGDISQDNSSASYLRFAGAVAALAAPQYWIAGNHDEIPKMKAALGADHPCFTRAFNVPGWRVIMLNSNVVRQVHGRLDPGELEFLAEELEASKHLSVLVCLHHNCVPVAAAWLPAGLRRLKSTWRAWRIVHSMRTGNRTVGQLSRALAAMPEVDLAGQPLPAHARSDDRYELLGKLQGVLAALGWSGMVVIVDRLDEPHLINGSAERMRLVIWPLLDNKFLKMPGLGFKLLLPEELYRFIEREDEQFNQRARLDKQNLVPALEWSGETLYDLASTRVKAASVGNPPATLGALFDDSVDQRRLIDGLRSLRVPRQLFKFLYRLLVAHCHAHTAEQPVYRIPVERFETTLAVFRRDQEAFDRGLAPR